MVLQETQPRWNRVSWFFTLLCGHKNSASFFIQSIILTSLPNQDTPRGNSYSPKTKILSHKWDASFHVAKLHETELHIECIHPHQALYRCWSVCIFIYRERERTLAQNQRQKYIFLTSTCHNKTPLKNHTFHLPACRLSCPIFSRFLWLTLLNSSSLHRACFSKIQHAASSEESHLPLQAAAPAAIYSLHQWLGSVGSSPFFL